MNSKTKRETYKWKKHNALMYISRARKNTVRKIVYFYDCIYTYTQIQKQTQHITQTKRYININIHTNIYILFDDCMLDVRAQCFHDKWAEREGHHKDQSELSTTDGHSVRAVVNVHVVNSERWLHLWFLVRCRLQCAMNNSWVSVVRFALSGNTYTKIK